MGVGSVRHRKSRLSVVVCVSCKLSAKVWHAVYVVVHADEVAELKKELEQLKGSNVALDEENEHYSGVLVIVLFVLRTLLRVALYLHGLHPLEEMVALQRENESLKEKLKELHSRIMKLHGVYICVCMYVCTYFNYILYILKLEKKNSRLLVSLFEHMSTSVRMYLSFPVYLFTETHLILLQGGIG